MRAHSDRSNAASSDSDYDFDWEAEDDEERKQVTQVHSKEARRGRRLYLLFLRLARPIRIFIIAAVGGGHPDQPFHCYQHPLPEQACRL